MVRKKTGRKNQKSPKCILNAQNYLNRFITNLNYYLDTITFVILSDTLTIYSKCKTKV